MRATRAGRAQAKDAARWLAKLPRADPAGNVPATTCRFGDACEREFTVLCMWVFELVAAPW
eukprot:594895-Prymnesium_polylepis.1